LKQFIKKVGKVPTFFLYSRAIKIKGEMNMNEHHLVFVYGTLRKHERNHFLLKHSECIASQCWIKGILIDTGCGFPAVILDGEGRVYGELYKVSDETLEQLDQLEGYEGPGKSNHYERTALKVQTDFSEETAFVYYYDESGGITPFHPEIGNATSSLIRRSNFILLMDLVWITKDL
jgi:gamma-glutamylcyclotransferase (GGCT)/AIG2-like uncharacterized protein YtfP